MQAVTRIINNLVSDQMRAIWYTWMVIQFVSLWPRKQRAQGLQPGRALLTG